MTALHRSTKRIAPAWVFVFSLSVLALAAAIDVSQVSAQARGEVIDPFTSEPTASRSELLDPFADAPRAQRASSARTPRTGDLLDPFGTTARRVVHYLAELLDPWSD